MLLNWKYVHNVFTILLPNFHFFITHIQTEKISSWNCPTVHVCCFMLARAFTKTVVSRIHILFCFLDRAFSIMKTKNKTNEMLKLILDNLLLINHSNMFRPLNRSHHQGVRNPWELQSHCIDLLQCCYVYVFTSLCDSCGMRKHSTAVISRREHIYITTL